MAVNANTATTSTLGELTAEQVQSVLIQPLELASVFLAAGPQIIDTAGPLRIPRAPTFDTADIGWIAEGETISEADADAGELKLLPSGMSSIKTITRFTSELARQSVTAIEPALRASLVRSVAAKLDAQLMGAAGNGTTTPRGLFAHAGTQSVDQATVGSLPDALLEAHGKALAAGVNTAGLRIVLRPETLTALRKLKAGDELDTYLLGSAESGPVSTILGMPFSVSNHVPAGKLAVVDFSQIVVARDVSAAVKLLDQTYATTDEIGLRVVTRYDAAPLHADAIVVVTLTPPVGP